MRAADRAGLDLVGIQGPPYQRRFPDAWTLISTLVPHTERIRFFPDVANLPLRPPAMLAKAAASLDVISGGLVGAAGALKRYLNPEPRYSVREKPLHGEFEKGVLAVGDGSV